MTYRFQILSSETKHPSANQVETLEQLGLWALEAKKARHQL